MRHRTCAPRSSRRLTSWFLRFSEGWGSVRTSKNVSTSELMFPTGCKLYKSLNRILGRDTPGWPLVQTWFYIYGGNDGKRCTRGIRVSKKAVQSGVPIPAVGHFLSMSFSLRRSASIVSPYGCKRAEIEMDGCWLHAPSNRTGEPCSSMWRFDFVSGRPWTDTSCGSNTCAHSRSSHKTSYACPPRTYSVFCSHFSLGHLS